MRHSEPDRFHRRANFAFEQLRKADFSESIGISQRSHNSTFCVPLWNLEDKACCSRMRDQPISCIGDASLRGGDAAAGIEHAALGAAGAARLAHAAHE